MLIIRAVFITLISCFTYRHHGTWGAVTASSDVQRKLTAILVSDVVGYSRLMGDDPEGTLTTLTAYRKVFLSHIESRSGRVVDAKGDAILAEFASVVDAVIGEAAQRILRAAAEFIPAGYFRLT